MSATAVQGTVTPSEPLTGADRCDRCRGQAYVRAVLPSGFELLFCGHHWTQHMVGVLATDAIIQDELAKLVRDASPFV